ncbi:Ig-like domain-containing protein [Mucilaginibacter mali]|uniref:Ig-like domain-containing protein n=1 Tax=Mucilaginibacter mali TaxID=2740462 RepID=A0A7D4TVM6_9SPHI|nr:glucoamylase family protein [Mucilaginibacter mali]QKJ30675.1 Ig-like domain-containing protein [Mucilaginibacter mali]
MLSIRLYQFYYSCILVAFLCCFASCKKSSPGGDGGTTVADATLAFTVNGSYNGTLSYPGLGTSPTVVINFSEAIDPATVTSGVSFTTGSSSVAYNQQLQNGNKTLTITPQQALLSLSSYTLSIGNTIKTANGGRLINPVNITLGTGLDDTDKFPRISDDDLLTLVQKQTFKYFYDMAHPVSGMALERNTAGNTVTSGGSGFGIMALVTGVSRNFITRAEGLARMQKIVAFLKTADRFHGAYSHWIDGNTGKALPFSTKDDGGDLVETSYLMAGLLTARQYFNGTDAAETTLRNDINTLYNGVEWSWYRNNNSNVLYWHWSPNYNWDMNVPIRGWNECLITYVMAGSSTTYPIPKSVYDAGWAQNGAMKNGNTYYGAQLPLGPANGGPLFLDQYSFLGINPKGLSDAYANYETQAKAHTLINYNYCKANPKAYLGYGENCWGLTASDIPGGYAASSPTNDLGVIAPTAAISSMPYTPTESMQALKFFYYKIGHKTWGTYGFYDAFNLQTQWFASSTLAIDQGPIIIMIENYRTGLIWNLFMSCPEVKAGMRNFGFTGPNL